MRILAVIEGTGTGGAETSLGAMAPLMREHGVALEVAYFHDRPGARERLAAAQVPMFNIAVRRSRLRAACKLARLIRTRRPDLIHTMVFEADIVGRIASAVTRVPVVSSVINVMYGPEQTAHVAHPFKIRLAQLADVATAKRVKRFHAVSHSVADIMTPRLRLRQPVDVIYRGRDGRDYRKLDETHRRVVRAQLGFTDASRLVVAVARQEPQKGLACLIEAMKGVVEARPGTRLLIAGREGSDTRDLYRLVEDLRMGDHVQFLGHRSDVSDLLGAADVFAMPSRWEGLGGSVIEALATECPVVCSDLPVFREVATDHAGNDLASFAAVDDADALQACIAEVLANPAAARARAVAGRRHFVENFELHDVARRMADFYNTALA